MDRSLVSDAVAVNVTAAPATCGLARSEARSVTAWRIVWRSAYDEIDRL